MKVKNESLVYNIPIRSGICVITGNQTKNLNELLTNYFVRKKKNSCIVLDEDGDLIKNEDASYIYISSTEDLLDIFEMKPKTILNTEITDFINTNQDSFRTIEEIRNLSYELLTDNGMYRLKKIMGNGIDNNIEFEIDDFNVSRLLQTLALNIERLSKQQQFIVLYNIFLYTNRNHFCIVYIDFDVNAETLDWLQTIKNDNILFLVNNESICADITENIDTMLVLSKYDFVNEIEYEISSANKLSYCLNPYILKNYEYQTEKNRLIIDDFRDDRSTFLIKFTANMLK